MIDRYRIQLNKNLLISLSVWRNNIPCAETGLVAVVQLTLSERRTASWEIHITISTIWRDIFKLTSKSSRLRKNLWNLGYFSLKLTSTIIKTDPILFYFLALVKLLAATDTSEVKKLCCNDKTIAACLLCEQVKQLLQQWLVSSTSLIPAGRNGWSSWMRRMASERQLKATALTNQYLCSRFVSTERGPLASWTQLMGSWSSCAAFGFGRPEVWNELFSLLMGGALTWQQNKLTGIIIWRRPTRTRMDVRRSEAGACFWLRICIGRTSPGWDAAGGCRMWLCRRVQCPGSWTGLSINYSTREGAPETTALGAQQHSKHESEEDAFHEALLRVLSGTAS